LFLKLFFFCWIFFLVCRVLFNFLFFLFFFYYSLFIYDKKMGGSSPPISVLPYPGVAYGFRSRTLVVVLRHSLE